MSEEERNGFSPVLRRILEKLGDGLPHSKDELLSCLEDLSTEQALWKAISRIRDRLHRRNETIVCESVRRRTFYRWVRLLPSANDGRT